MALVNHAIANLFNGISQQPPSLRLPTQGELQENGYSSIVEGLRKRPPTKHIAKLSSTPDANAYIHTINRDSTERYKVVVTNGDLKVFALDGTQKAVNFPSGKAYLNSANPWSDFSLITVQDYTFVLNRTVVTATTSSVFNQKTVPAITSITSSGTTATVTATAHGLSAGNTIVVSGCAQSAYNGTFVVASASTNTLTYALPTSTTSPATGTPSWYAYASIKGAVNRYADLPHQAYDSASATYTWWWLSPDVPLATAPVVGDVWKIEGELANNYTAYYVKYNGNSWVECPCPGVYTTLDATTLPWKLTRNADGTFTFSPITWSNRLVGDDNTCPMPSFIGSTLNDIFFYRDRLGVISNESAIFSRSGKFFTLFPKSATVVRDDDPIDAALTTNKVATLRYALSFNTSLLLFSDQSQFTVSARDVLTPKSININPTTEYEMSKLCKPVGAGQDLYFAVDHGGYTGIKEYYVQPLTYTFDAADVTAHCPKYVPSQVFKLAASTVEDCLFALSRADRNALYVYKYYWGDKDTKLQSSWSKWVFDAQDVILNVDTIGTVLYLTTQRADGIYLESLDLQSASVDTLNVLVHLDRKVVLTGSYNSGTNTTTWTLPYADTASNFQIILGPDFGTSAGSVLIPNHPTSTTLTVAGDFSAHSVFTGRQYTFRYRFSPQYYKDQEKSAVSHAQLIMKNMQVFFTSSGYFRAEVTPTYRDTFTYVFSGRQLGSSDWVLGSIALGKGVFEFPLYADSDFITIDLINDSYLPCYFQSAEWEANLSTRSKRV